MKKSNLIAAVLLVIVSGTATAVWFLAHRSPSMPMTASSDKGQVLYWYDPMKPEVHFGKPGKSPFMDMQLVPKFATEDAGTQAISIDPRMVQNLAIRTARVERGKMARQVRTTGIVTANEKGIEVVQSRAAGWVERLHVRAAGDPVRKAELLAEVYSPDLLAAEHELVVAMQAAHDSSGTASLLEAVRNRLSLLGLGDAQIADIEKTGHVERRVAFYSPLNGVVTDLGVREGAQVSPGMSLFTLADLSKVWVTAQISESQATWIEQGQSAEVQVLALPGRSFAGQVDYVYPDLMAGTRTLKARIVLDNPRLELKPGMYGDVTLTGGAEQEALLVPSESLIRTGTRNTIIVADGGGRFHPVEVVAGDETNGKVAILKGLQDGQDVVTSGQFLIDSEANLRGAFSHLTVPEQGSGTQVQP